MQSTREERRGTFYKTVAITMTLLFHVALFGGIYYAMDGDTGQTEMVDEGKDEIKKSVQARS